MVFDVSKISGIGEFSVFKENKDSASIFYRVNNRVFLVLNKNTLEMRTDEKLKKLLIGKYESVMESRYFGRGGIEIVNSGQLEKAELEDLIRLSYNLTKEINEVI